MAHAPVPFESKDGVTSVPVAFETTQGRALLVCDRVPRQMELSVRDDGGKIAVEVRSPDADMLVPFRLDGVSCKPYYAVVRGGVWTRTFDKGPFGKVSATSLIDGAAASPRQ